MESLCAKIFNSLKTEKRIRTLRLIEEGKNLSQVADELDMSYAGVHSYFEDFEDTHLVKKKDNETKITEFGEVALEVLSDLEENLKENLRDRIKEEVKEDITGYGYPSTEGAEILEELLEEMRGSEEE